MFAYDVCLQIPFSNHHCFDAIDHSKQHLKIWLQTFANGAALFNLEKLCGYIKIETVLQ